MLRLWILAALFVAVFSQQCWKEDDGQTYQVPNMGYGCTASYKYRSGGYLLDDQDRAKPDDMWDARSNGKESGGCWRERDDPRDVECICLSNLCNTDNYFRQYIVSPHFQIDLHFERPLSERAPTTRYEPTTIPR
ncbi:hypothetical protein WR25_12842 isoform B [Diploscapter pachys]|uniref:Uncharacterized protein n=1 Tax=Diploscapter pachys TaxID=2018661 RepID=A0A2A2JBN1_9BILA|nr:hypothetical protein WR25_12842 isoform B [Diploscapter pachys]